MNLEKPRLIKKRTFIQYTTNTDPFEPNIPPSTKTHYRLWR